MLARVVGKTIRDTWVIPVVTFGLGEYFIWTRCNLLPRARVVPPKRNPNVFRNIFMMKVLLKLIKVVPY